MDRVVYLNGEYLPADQAKVSIFDRALLFADAVYEVTGVLHGKLVDFDGHMRRLQRSLAELSIPAPLDTNQILDISRSLVTANGLDEGLIYMQITRGEAERDFVYAKDLKPNVFMFTQVKATLENRMAETGIELKSVPDIRWARRDIKSTSLLAQVMAKRAAYEAGAYEALMIGADGYVTEGGATSFFIVKDETVITRPLSNEILPGITRQALIELCRESRFALSERRVTLPEVYDADEAFITGASTYVLPVTRVDGRHIGGGRPGKTATRMRQIYIEHAEASAV